MKFRKIELNNFMRYQGKNVIEFSCDNEKNVTIVMGDNTFGKTTLAQAFRWGLYGEIIDTRYGKSKEIVLLNKDVLTEMGDDDPEEVSVMLEVEEKDVITQFKRVAKYLRLYPELKTRRISEKLYMRKKVGDDLWGDWQENESDRKNLNCVTENIKMMFPQELSSYFFFDGERWSDEKKTNKEIKNSINTLMGITPLVSMKIHLFNGNSKLAVVKELEAKITGNSTRFEDIRKRIDHKENQIADWEQQLENAKHNAEMFRAKIETAENILNSNQRIEQYQKEYTMLEKGIASQQESLSSYYADLVRTFSKDAYKFFAAPLLEEVIEMLKSVNLEGKDIPDVTSSTLDYLIKNQICLCGNCIGEKEANYIEELRKVIPPNAIGSYVGQYQNKFEEWQMEKESFVDSLKEKATGYEGTKAQIEEDEMAKERLERIIDGKINFSVERQKLNANKSNERAELEKIRKCEVNIEDAKRQIQIDTEALKREAAHTEKNRKIQKMISYANALYDYTVEVLKKREEPLMNELNEIIKENFAGMFHEQEKYAQMEDDYRLHLYYKKMGGGTPVEEMNLSEGEIIARNFVFIVSILQLAQKKKMEDGVDDSDVLNLPLVLDGPFSKLGDVNTGLIAKVLPEAAEQVIVFMLDKDWEASGLEEYTLPEYRYYVSKDVDGNSSTLKRGV